MVERLYCFASATYPIGQVLLGRLHGAVFNELNVHTGAAVVIARELVIRVTDDTGNGLRWGSHSPFKNSVMA